jgi:hypothetical protein
MARKFYRVYFNRRSEAPQIWSVDEGDQTTEINVQWVRFEGIFSETVFDSTVTDKENSPCAWIGFYAKAEFEGGGVSFHG